MPHVNNKYHTGAGAVVPHLVLETVIENQYFPLFPRPANRIENRNLLANHELKRVGGGDEHEHLTSSLWPHARMFLAELEDPNGRAIDSWWGRNVATHAC